MSTLISIIVAILVIGVLLWAIQRILAVVAIPDPFRTIVWVLAVLVAVFAFLQITGLYTFSLH